MSCIMIFFMGLCLYGSSALLPILVQSQFGYDATLAGLVLSPGGIAVVFLMPIAGRLVGRIQSRYLIALGMLCLTVGLSYSSITTPQTNYNTFVVMRVLQVMGAAAAVHSPSALLAFKDIPKEKSSKASALYALARNMGGSIGIAVLESYLVRHQQIHQTYLSANLTPLNPAYRNALSQVIDHISAGGMGLANATHQAGGRMYQQLLDQSYFLGYGDTYRVMAFLTIVLAVVALFMPRNNPLAKKAPDAAAAH